MEISCAEPPMGRKAKAYGTYVVASLHEKGALKEDIDVDAAADILWTLNHPSLYHLLVGRRGWSPDRYERWLDDLLSSQLIGDADLPEGRP